MTVDIERANAALVDAGDTEWQRLVQQEGLILEVTERLYELMEVTGVSKAELARRVGRTRGFVSQVLSGGRNMTLRTLADFAWALGHRVEVEARPIESRRGELEVRPQPIEHDVAGFVMETLAGAFAAPDADVVRAVETLLTKKALAEGASYGLLLRKYVAEHRAPRTRAGSKHRPLQAVREYSGRDLANITSEARGVA